MSNFFTRLMAFLGIIVGIIIIIFIISEISWKIYVMIYSNYTLGLLFPYPEYKSIVKAITAVFIILAFIVLRIIIKLRNRK